MIDVDEAHSILLENISAGQVVTVPLCEGLFRTLAEPIVCDIDYPPFDRATMDGYAVRAEDVAHPPARLQVVGQIPAGTTATTSLEPGQAMQINTGAPLPTGADAVVRVESTELVTNESTVIVKSAAGQGKFITRRAAYVKAQQVVLPARTRLAPLEISAAAAAGASYVTVYRKPTVSVLVTGDELVDIDSKPRQAQIRDSNRYLLETLITAEQASPNILGITGDDRHELRQKIEEGLAADILCITGGISMGAFDFVPDVLKECGATFFIHKMKIKPGRPTIFAMMPDGTPVFALPGNPGGALVGFVLLVRPAIAVLEGRHDVLPRTEWVRLHGSLTETTDRRTFIPGRMDTNGEGTVEVRPIAWSGSGDTFGWTSANVLMMRPPQSKGAADGELVSTLRLQAS